LVKFHKILCGIEFGESNHKKVYDCDKEMNKKLLQLWQLFCYQMGYKKWQTTLPLQALRIDVFLEE